MHLSAQPRWSADSEYERVAHELMLISVECHLTEQRWAVSDERNVSVSTACAAAV